MQAAGFEAERSRLVAIATRILGSGSDAQDVVQEAWLRLAVTDDVEDLPAWLTTVTTRLCLDHLRKRRTRTSFEAEAAEFIAGTTETTDPEADALLAEQVGGAMQIVFDALAPAERAALVLHDVFGYPFDDIGAMLGRSSTAVRQLASRARRKVQGAPELPAERAARTQGRAVTEAFLDAAHNGQVMDLLRLLAPDAVMHVDAQGQRMGAQPGYDGAEAVAGRFDGAQGARPATIDGDPGGAWIVGGDVRVAFVFHVGDGVIREIELIADPEVLATLEVVPGTEGR